MVNQLALSVIVLLPFVISMGLRKQEWDTIGISRRNLLPALFIGAVASLVAVVVNSRAPAAYWLAGGTLFKLLGQLFVGFSEEAVFRGYIQIQFSAWLPRAGWILVALIFSLWHIPQKLPCIYTSFSVTAFSLALYFLYGLAAGWSMKRTDNIAGLALLHAVIHTIRDI